MRNGALAAETRCPRNRGKLNPATLLCPKNSRQEFGKNFKPMLPCKHLLISNRTFAWWTAWLRQSPAKVVVRPGNWLLDARTDTTDVLPLGWARV